MEYDLNFIILISIGYGLLVVILASIFLPSMNFFLLSGVRNYHKKIRFESQYFRDILSYTPSEIYYIYNKGFGNNPYGKYCYSPDRMKKLFYINLLKMNLLGYVSIDFSIKDNFKIILNDVIILDKEYKIIYDYIFNKIAFYSEVRLYDIYEYVDKHYTDTFFKTWDNLIRKSLIKKGFAPGNITTFYGDKMKTYYKVAISIIIIAGLFMPFPANILIICIFPLLLLGGYYESKNIIVYSKYSIHEYQKINALKNFLEDFTIVDERGPEYSTVLENYMVYACIFDMLDNEYTFE